MSNASPETSSLNRSTSVTTENPLKLVIKAANQKYEDFVVDEIKLEWTIKQLKVHLTENYPQKPEYVSIRLIYSGKMLHDHWTLNECIRQNSEVTSHIIHLVLASTSSTKPEVKSTLNTSALIEDQDTDAENELTPDTSSMSSGSQSSTSSLFSSPHVTNPNADNNGSVPITEATTELNSSGVHHLTPKQQYEHIHSEYLRHYESMGISVQENAWYSAYVQQLALYKHMYSNYLQAQTDPSIQVNFANFVPPPNPINSQHHANEQQPAHNNQAPPQEAQPPPQAARHAPAAAAPPAEVVERDDDWLSLLHTIVSFLVLLSIIYYYSSLERFMVIFAIVIGLIVYHNGWFSLQRRQIQPRVVPAAQANNENPENEQPNENDFERAQAPASNNPNYFRLFVSFVLTFFTSLIPERPRIAN